MSREIGGRNTGSIEDRIALILEADKPANDNEPPEDDNIPLTPGGLPDTGAPGH